ncbi:ABC transporter substrate-binding protein [Pendulispora brunnea]|uniref:ABC transporter substrate-binding protein n=1 Tax=Pendulispora brunnea TaxID=2905690 RepID=A0ABZ2KL67_9BACT
MNRKVSLSRIGAIVLFGACGSTLLLDQVACSKEDVPPASQDTITIGMSAALTGGYSGVGKAMAQGAQTAIDLINSKGGVLGRPLRLDVQDDRSSNADDNGFATLKEVFNGFRDRKVSAIIGPGASVQTTEAQKITFPVPILQISAWSTGVGISDLQQPWPSRYLYRTAPSDVFQRIAMKKRMQEQVSDGTDGGTKARCSAPFLVYASDPLGLGFSEYFIPLIGEQNTLKVDTGQQSQYTQAVQKIRAARPLPDCVLFVTYEQVTAALIIELKAQYKPTEKLQLIGTDATYDPGFLRDVGNLKLVENMIGVVPDTRPRTQSFAAFSRIFHAQSGPGDAADDPPPFASSAFDAAALIALAIQKAKTADNAEAIRNALVEVSRGYPADKPGKSGQVQLVRPDSIALGLSVLAGGGTIDYDGASGTVDFDEKGDIRSGYVKWEIINGNFVDVDRFTQDELNE